MVQNPVKIVHFSDTHFTSRPQSIEEDFSHALKFINRTKHEFTVFTGDLTQDGLVEDYLGFVLGQLD